MTVTTVGITRATSLLRSGGVVAFPTETVYGLGALAMNLDAVRRVFAIKGRPADHPLIVHLASAEWLEEWARDIPDAARLLAEAFWPGPLTLVLPRQPWVPDEVTGGQDSVALRVPSHPVALQLINASGALVAPSANRFGHISPTRAEHVREELGDAVNLVLDGGACRIGVESTIVSLLHGEPLLLRPGGISVTEIEAVLGRSLKSGARHSNVRAPGMLASHYAPTTALEVLPAPELRQRAKALAGQDMQVAVMSLEINCADVAALPGVSMAPMPPCAVEYARVLYSTLRTLDGGGMHVLLAEAPPDTPEWLAVRDRLSRAAHNTLMG